RRTAGVPEEVVFRTKPLIAAEQIRQAVADGVPRAPVVADAAYGNDTRFRQALRNMGAGYGTGIRRGHSADAIRLASG
ncbi:MAG: transposase, partial [Acidobacteriota bacterium]